MQGAELRELRRELSAHKAASRTMANLLCALSYPEMTISKEITDRMEGASVSIREDGDDVIVTVRERTDLPQLELS